MLAHRLRRWPNIEPALGDRLVLYLLGGIVDCLVSHRK